MPVTAAPASPSLYYALSAGTILSLTVSCYVEEVMFKTLEGFDYHNFVAVAELFMFAVFSMVAMRRSPPPAASQAVLLDEEGEVAAPKSRRRLMALYFGVGVSMSLASSVGKVSYKYLNYASGTILKSMKLLPVMLLSIAYLKRQFTTQDYAVAALMTMSAMFVGLGDNREDPNFEILGVVLSFACLFAQAVQNNLQDQALRDYGASVAEVMLYTNAIGFGFAIVSCALSGELIPATIYFSDPHRAFLLFVRSITFYIGAQLYVRIIKEFGAVTAVTVTTARKVLTIVGSYILLPSDKVFSTFHLCGTFAFAVATYLEVAQRIAKHKNKLTTT